jgi:SAM-dependent methyltransferase
MIHDTSIKAVRDFWENNPLFLGESIFEFGSAEFFKNHTNTVLQDCFAGKLDIKTIPKCDSRSPVLDAGCGVGFWTEIFVSEGFTNVYVCDLTKRAITATLERVKLLGKEVTPSIENVEMLTYPTNYFAHVNCQGVIHHTPNTQNAVHEIFRVLAPGGTASLSVYYKSPLLKLFSFFPHFGSVLEKIGFSLKGRDRETIFQNKNIAEVVRMYDGKDNPIGKYYSRKEFKKILNQFEIETFYLHYFPIRHLKIKIPKAIHFLLDRYLGLMLYANVRKPVQASVLSET